jgi:redox-sensitive bicupin YhaK (pirin superfamily)
MSQTPVTTSERSVVALEDGHVRPMMGLNVLEPLPSARIPYSAVDPFVLVHEATVPITPEWASRDTGHPHRGFDNIWYLLSGTASTGHSTGPGGAIERARLQTGSLLKLRTGRGVWHAEGIGEDEVREGIVGEEMHSILFWVNLARKDKDVAPTSQVLAPEDIPVRQEGDATVRVLVGEGSPVELGTPGLILDVTLPSGGGFRTEVPSEFNAFVYMLDGEATIGVDGPRARKPQIALLGPGSDLTVSDAEPGTRFVLMAATPYGEQPIFNGPFVD